jgi:hypothetical protein
MLVTTCMRRWSVIIRIQVGDYVLTIEIPLGP